MAKVDLARRAQIGQEKRARTRAALVTAAKSLFALRSIESVTIDEIVAEAELAKGTFYTHFDDLDALTAAVADELVAAFDDLMQPARLAIADPLDIIIVMMTIMTIRGYFFPNECVRKPRWGFFAGAPPVS